MSGHGGTPKHRTNRRQSSNPFTSKSKKKPKHNNFAQEQAGSSIFHELDPSPFPISKQHPNWQQSSDYDACGICLTKIDSQIFGTKKRHCKKCGRVVCIPCSGIRIRNSRVCIQCNQYYLDLNNLLNQWFRTNRNIRDALCGYDTYTLETCSSLKRTLFILNHYQECLLLKKEDVNLSESKKRDFQKLPKPGHTPSETSRKIKARAPYDITHIKIRQFIDRLPKYGCEMFINDIHHLKQMHFKRNEEFKISHYERKHQWEIRAYSWRKIGQCSRYGCPYGIEDTRNKDSKEKPLMGIDVAEKKDDTCIPAGNPQHKKNPSIINMDQDIPNILNNMHIVLLHGVDDTDTAHGKRDSGVQELYDLLPPTPMSPQTGTTLAGQSFFDRKPHAPDDDADFKLPDNQTEEKPKVVLTEMQEKMLSIEVRQLADIEWTDERHQVLCYWLDVCCYRFNFFSASQYEWDAIQRKKQLLSDILDYLDMTEDIWNDETILRMIMKMIKANLFRSLPLTFRMLLATPDYCQEDDGEDFEDPNYPHLCYVYEIALMFVRHINVDDKTRKKYLGKSFIIPLTELFASEDVREREYLKAILHGIYARNMRLRRLIRTQMSHCCWRVIYTPNRGDDIENGISECLQLVCSIIQGLTTPIKQEYKNILYNVLIPLHKANQRKLQKFHETLLACCIQFILKDLSIGLDILSGLLKYWPFQSAQKSDMFLKEVVIIINTMMTDIDTAALDDDDADEEEKRKRRERNCFKFTQRGRIIGGLVIDKLIECMISDNHCLSEKALLAFGEVGVQKLIDLDKDSRWTKILSILFDNRDNRRHWCRPLHESFEEALDTFVIRDSKGVDAKEKKYKKQFAKNPINQFKNGYNPIYPSPAVLSINPTRQGKYERLKQMAEQNRKEVMHHPIMNGSHKSKSKSPPPEKALPPMPVVHGAHVTANGQRMDFV